MLDTDFVPFGDMLVRPHHGCSQLVYATTNCRHTEWGNTRRAEGYRHGITPVSSISCEFYFDLPHPTDRGRRQLWARQRVHPAKATIGIRATRANPDYSQRLIKVLDRPHIRFPRMTEKVVECAG